MNKRRQKSIVASIRADYMDVRLGLRTPKQWAETYDQAVEAGVQFPDDLDLMRAHLHATAQDQDTLF